MLFLCLFFVLATLILAYFIGSNLTSRIKRLQEYFTKLKDTKDLKDISLNTNGKDELVVVSKVVVDFLSIVRKLFVELSEQSKINLSIANKLLDGSKLAIANTQQSFEFSKTAKTIGENVESSLYQNIKQSELTMQKIVLVQEILNKNSNLILSITDGIQENAKEQEEIARYGKFKQQSTERKRDFNKHFRYSSSNKFTCTKCSY